MACGYCPSTSWSGQPGQRKRDVRPHPAAPSQRAQQGQGLGALTPGHEQALVTISVGPSSSQMNANGDTPGGTWAAANTYGSACRSGRRSRQRIT
jgi:hypothetical protein